MKVLQEIDEEEELNNGKRQSTHELLEKYREKITQMVKKRKIK